MGHSLPRQRRDYQGLSHITCKRKGTLARATPVYTEQRKKQASYIHKFGVIHPRAQPHRTDNGTSGMRSFTPRLHLERLDRLAHDDRNPFPRRCRVSRVRCHGRDLRGPGYIRNLALRRIRHDWVRDHALLPVRRSWRAQPRARITWRRRRRGSVGRNVPKEQLTIVRCVRESERKVSEMASETPPPPHGGEKKKWNHPYLRSQRARFQSSSTRPR